MVTSHRTHDIPGYIIALCAAAMTGLVAFGQLSPGKPLPTSLPESEIRRVEDWPELLTDRPRLGGTAPLVTMLYMVDFECPVCKAYARTVDAALKRYPDELAVLFLYFPLSYHRFAIPAARAAECADQQGHFQQVASLLYANQDSLGLKEWASFATDARLPDPSLFAKCVSSSAQMPRLHRDTLLVRKIGARGTPTVIVDGWKWGRPLDLHAIDSLIRARRLSAR